jgi:hypothetical protein
MLAELLEQRNQPEELAKKLRVVIGVQAHTSLSARWRSGMALGAYRRIDCNWHSTDD